MTKNTQVSIEDVGSLIAWLIEQAIQAADADQPRDAGMLTWAAQVIGECVDEDAPEPPEIRASACPSIAERAYIAFVQICKGNSDDAGTYAEDERLVRAALERLHVLESPTPASPVSTEMNRD